MNIMVFDVAAVSGGALSVLNDFYDEVSNDKDKAVRWFFVVSFPVLKTADNIHILNFPWVKKSWFHRLFFDYFVAPRLISKFNIVKVLSLQNTIVPRTDVFQIAYVHNSLPFVEYRFSFQRSKLLWVYQNVIGRLIKRSIRRAGKVIVQTNWMKKALEQNIGRLRPQKIHVVPPRVSAKVERYFEPTNELLPTFFYPASGVTFKNHRVIVDACKALKEQGIDKYEVIFTLDGDENGEIASLRAEVDKSDLPVTFCGSVTREDVFDLYTRSAVVFPSFIESSPLPLSEARLHNTIILASDCAYAHEVLEGYPNAYFFDPFDKWTLVSLMRQFVEHNISHSPVTARGEPSAAQKRLVDCIVG